MPMMLLLAGCAVPASPEISQASSAPTSQGTAQPEEEPLQPASIDETAPADVATPAASTPPPSPPTLPPTPTPGPPASPPPPEPEQAPAHEEPPAESLAEPERGASADEERAAVATHPPSLDLWATPLEGAAPLRVLVIAHIADEADDVTAWALALGASREERGNATLNDSFEVVFEAPGEHEIHLRAVDAAGSTAEASLVVRALAPRAPANASLVALPAAGPAPHRVVFTLSASHVDAAPISWNLDFGDGSPPENGTGALDARLVEHVYARPGSYEARLDALHPDGNATANATIDVRPRLNRAPNATFTLARSDHVVTLDATASVDPDENDTLAWSWDLDGDGIEDASGPRVTTRLDRDATVVLTVRDAAGLTATAAQTIVVPVREALVLLADAAGGPGAVRFVALPSGDEIANVPLTGSAVEIAVGRTTAFVSEDSEDGSSVIVETIDLATRRVTHTITIGAEGAAHVFLEPTRERAWVVLLSTASVAWVTPDGAHGLVGSATLAPVPGSAMGKLAFSPDGRYAWKTQVGDGTVRRIDLTTQPPSASTMAVAGAGAHDIGHVPANDILVVANTGADTVAFLQATNMVLLGTLTTPAEPTHVACQARGSTCVVGLVGGGHMLVRTSSVGGELVATVQGAGALHDACATPNDDSFVLSATGTANGFLAIADATTGIVKASYDAVDGSDGGAAIDALASGATWYAVRGSASARSARLYELHLPTGRLFPLVPFSLPSSSWTAVDVGVSG